MKNIYLVTGGLGGIGSHLVDALLDDPATHEVRVVDNLSSGKIENLYQQGANVADGRLKIHNIDLLPPTIWLSTLFKDVSCVLHLAANPDARKGIENTHLDLEQELLVTFNVLDAMRRAGCRRIIFSSSGTIYGDAGLSVCKEGFGERLPISLYGAGKLACEGFISGFCGTFDMSAILFRFGNVCGERAGHGCIFDFINQLKAHPDHLDVLGDGNQSKPYIYVKDIVAGMMHGLKLIEAMPAKACEPYNLAPEDATSVRVIAEELMRQMGLPPNIVYGETEGGWAGDVPHSRMDMSKFEATGFKLNMSSWGAVRHAISEILKEI